MLFSFHCPSCKGKLEADASLSGSQANCPQCGRAVAIPEPRVDAGATLAGFRLERRLGKGGMGEVWLAQQLSMKRQVAVKILPPSFAANPGAVERFLREGQLAAKLDHANIVTVHEAGEDSGNYYLAMAYVEGESLDLRLKRDEVIPEAEALAIVRAIADALAYAWEEFRLLHRDLKPANIMVDRRQRVFLMDLGLAKSVGEESGMTLSGTILGTPLYMSPEQASGTSDLGVPSDVYSLGATLYHLVTGTAPFTADSALKILHQHVHEPLPPPRERNPQVTDACSRLLETMLAKPPAARYADWRALIADLDRVLQGQTPATPAPAASPLGVPPSGGLSAAPAAVGAAGSPRRTGRTRPTGQTRPTAPAAAKEPAKAAPATAKGPSRLPLALAAAAVVTLLVVGGIVAARRGPAAAKAPGVPGKDPLKGELQTLGVPPSGDPAKHPAPAVAAAGQPQPSPTGQTSQTGPTRPTAPAPAAATTEPTRAATPTPGQPWTVPDLGLALVPVAAGTFQMGSGNGGPDEQPVHRVTVSKPFWLGKYEVTQAEYEAVAGTNPSKFGGARLPVETVSWTDAAAFCVKLTERERAAGRLPAGYEYRLPTEAEWEYACRAGTTGDYAGEVDAMAWYGANSGGKAHEVGTRQANAWGLYDMHGNVWEWCLDWSGGYPSGTVTDPTGPATGSMRAYRGACWNDRHAFWCRSATRNGGTPSFTYDTLGFRVSLATSVASPAVPAAPAREVAMAGQPPTGQTSQTGPTSPTPPVAAPPAESATPVAPAAPPAAAQAKLTALLDAVAADLAGGKPAAALQHWQAGAGAPELAPLAEPVAAIGKTLGEVANTAQHIAESFRADVGKTAEIELVKGKVTCEVREATAAGIRVNQALPRGQGKGTLGRTIAWGELSNAERLRRLGPGDSPELNLQRGLLALDAGRPDTARPLFEKAGGPLGQALVAQVEAQRAAAVDAAAERALGELLRQIAGSPKVETPDEVTAAIRKRSGGDPKRRESARKLLAEFEKEWGGTETGRAWIPVVRAALAFPDAGKDWTVPDLGVALVPVAAGTFQMGLATGEWTEKPVHRVTITKPFWMGKYEVTQAEYEAVAGANPSQFKGARLPVEQVPWTAAAAFCTRLTERERAAGRLPAGYEYRLPTEAEWEYACRAGTTGDYAGKVDAMAWTTASSGGTTHEVGAKKPNAWGLYDMHGNVWERCLDGDNVYPSSSVTDPLNTQSASFRVGRGGCWGSGVWDVRSACRISLFGPSSVRYDLGFRLALAPVLPASPAPAR